MPRLALFRVVCVIFFSSAWGHWAHSLDGISNALMSIPTAATLTQGTIEFSPTFQLAFISQDFDPQGSFLPRKVMAYESQVNMRLTVGVLPFWEIGLQMPIMLNWQDDSNPILFTDRLSFATKIKCYQNSADTFRFSLYAILLMPLMFKTWNATPGAVVTYQPFPWLSFDLSVDCVLEWLQTWTVGVHYEAGVGVFVLPSVLQLMLEWSHRLIGTSPLNSKGTLSAGVNWIPNATFSLWVGGMFDLIGTNQPQGLQIATSFTVTFDGRGQPQPSLQ